MVQRPFLATPAEIEVVAFDTINTVFCIDDLPGWCMDYYAAHLHQYHEVDGVYKPLNFSKEWNTLAAHWDARGGIDRLRKRFLVVPLSNMPVANLARVSRRNGIHWDATPDLSTRKVFKPNHDAYPIVWQTLGVMPHQVLMVTANKDFGDLEAANDLGMQSVLIRDPEAPFRTIIDLAARLGC